MGGIGVAFITASPGRAIASPGVSADIEQRLARLQKDGSVNGLDALVVAKGPQLIFEHYETNDDEIWDTPNGRVTFGPTVLHDVRSVSKSVVGLLYGIALAEGKVPPPEARLYAQFPEYAGLAAQPGRDRLIIEHPLGMTLGLAWDELSFPYGDERNSETALMAAPDRFRYILARPIVAEPGVKWIYCGGATDLLGRLIAKGTGEKLLDYARRMLFEPLGFGPTAWTTDRMGVPHAASGLRLLPRDMLKVGQLVLMKGAWNGRQVVPAAWVTRCTTQVVPIEGRGGYGYQWYLGVIPAGPYQGAEWFAGIGWGGQRLFVVPRLDLVVAVNCGNYYRPNMEQVRIVNTVIAEAVMPALSS